VPLTENRLEPYNVLESLTPFWEPWIAQAQDEAKASIYRKLLTDTLATMDAVLGTYDILLFAPADKTVEEIEKFRQQAVHFCYMIIARWVHGVSLYTATGLGMTQIDDQLRSMLIHARRAVDRVVAPVSELPGFQLALLNPTRAIPMLNVFRQLFFEIVDFLARRFAAANR
jgi:hypothetical protein